MKLLLVDGSNMAMRAAFGGDMHPDQSTPIATGLIARAARQIGATHIICAMDSPAPSWRKELLPTYKAHRTVDTWAWLRAALRHWRAIGWHVAECPRFEADDIIATIARRARGLCPVFVLSGDSDLLALTAQDVAVVKPQNGGTFSEMSAWDVCEKYGIRSAALLPELKALTGEKGDNIPGVPGIGPVRACKLLAEHGNIENIIAAPMKCKHAATVARHADAARLALRLTTLEFDAPVAPIPPWACTFENP